MHTRKIAVITGAYKGSGKKISELFLRNNYRIYSLDKNYSSNIKILGNNTLYKIDISNVSQIKKFIKFIKKRETKIDCLVNNAGVTLKKKNNNLEIYWKKTLSINLDSIFFLSELLVPLLKKSSNASIVNISSISSKIAMSNNPAYNASKAGVLSLTSSQALDYSNYNIRANAICPGYIKTDMTKKSFKSKKLKNERLDRLMIKRYGSPEEVADLVYFLCGEKAKYINGQDVIIDGGLIKKGI